MKGCEDYSATIHIGHDKELSGPDLEDFLAHLTGCETCRTELEAEESLSSLLQRSRPLYTAPDALRARIIQAAESLHAHVPLRERMARAFSRLPRRTLNRPAFVAAILVATAGSLVVPGIVRQSNANSYIESAIAAHRGLVDGSLPLEVQSGSPSEVTAWFAGKVPFNFRLPSSHEQPGVEQVYRLIGGRLVNYKDGYVALVAYQMGQQKISLLVSSSSSAASAGGEEIRSGGILFHYSKEENLNVVTWSNHGLTYALVSSLPGSGRQSCLVCHQNLADRAQSSAHWVQQVSVPMRIPAFPN
jgi:hypothetical protein